MNAQTATLLVAIPVLATLIVLGLRREARLAAARRRAVASARLIAAFDRVGAAMSDLAPAAARAADALRGFGEALDRAHLAHRTAARPAHRAARSER